MKIEGVLPAIRSMKDFERVLEVKQDYVVFLETRLSQVKSLVKYAHQAKKKVIIHADLVQGLKVDEYGMEYLINDVKVDGIISTRANVIATAKRHNITGIQRLFAIDSHALDHNLKVCKKVQPDYIEVLPGIIPHVIKEIREETGIPIIAGGLIRTKEDAMNVLNGDASAITTSDKHLWDL
ncbi:glycerol-3-phosphate responsive antiterminator [Oceanobacillus senegalensis]|uniref:glycerol-3-phosphate responsive antiterminator n=1 Tax=Oceanobacillus senegalensis TaxID=1936063 RepID=UPI0015C467BE|nr:glycerol-3-phosphate responsive antiterminator [Oceanobacillus senegalensis]